ncbi:RDD family protein [Pseudomonadota bacterium]|nr:RDD family protein [Pseudomonadota bacterium]
MTSNTENHTKPSLFRYLGVMLYDTLLLLSVLLLAAAIAVAVNAISNNGEAIEAGNPFFSLYLLAVSYLFYGWFWMHGGQTLGMRTWKVYLINNTDTNITWNQATIRFFVAIIAWIPAGLGFWWLYFGKDNLSWPDALSGTKLHYSKNAKNKPLSRLS